MCLACFLFYDTMVDYSVGAVLVQFFHVLQLPSLPAPIRILMDFYTFNPLSSLLLLARLNTISLISILDFLP
jgi:hypothetical protein